jgi:hypothetical protein
MGYLPVLQGDWYQASSKLKPLHELYADNRLS